MLVAVAALAIAISAIVRPTRVARGDLPPLEAAIEARSRASVTVSRPGIASLTVRPGTLNVPARIVLDVDSPQDGPPAPVHADSRTVSVGSYIDATIRPAGKSSRLLGGQWNPPVELAIEIPQKAEAVPDGEFIVCEYALLPARQAWQPVPALRSGASLAATAANGYYLSKRPLGRTVHVLTRRLTLFGVFRRLSTSAAPAP
ncbi:MAG: hypothetical protein ACRDRT_03090 [Pseudonocardiaceae bacterium]